MASIVKRGKTYAVAYYDENGKQKWESGLNYTTAKTRKAELDFQKAKENQDNMRKNGKKNKKVELESKPTEDVDSEDDTTASHIKNLTVSEFLYEFFAKYGEKKWVDSTYTGNLGLVENYVHPYIGDKKLRTIKTKTVDDFYHFLETEAEPAANMAKLQREHISASTIHDIHKVLRCAFNLAVRWEYIKTNPFLNATLPDHTEAERSVLEPEQVLKVLEFTNRPEYYDYYIVHCAVLLAIGCTMRGGEIGGLQWDRVNMERPLIYVDRAIDRVRKASIKKLQKQKIYFTFPNLYPGTKTSIVIKQLKNPKSERYIETPVNTWNALLKLRDMQNNLKAELGPDGYMEYNLVICQANGRPLMTEHLNKRFKDVLEELNDPNIDAEKIVFHSLRHTSASTKLVLSHGDYNSVMHAGGWTNLEMLTRRYGSHSFGNDRQKMADKMDDFLNGSNSKEEAPPQVGVAQALKALAESNPDMLMEIVKSIQFAN